MMLKAENITFQHRKTCILKEIGLQIRHGEMLIIIGPNGAGKSTLMSVLANENYAKGSKIIFKNQAVGDWNIKEMAHHKAKFSQENNADIGLAVEEIVMMGRYPYFHSIPEKTDMEIVDVSMKKTNVFELRKRNYNSLSGGEKQRVHLARVLAQLENDIQGKLAFFDEPLNNLDVRHQYQLLETIRDFTQKGNAAVLVLHDLNLAAEFADTLLLLKKGQVVAHGTPNEIFKEEIIHRAYNFPCAVCPNPITNCPMVIFRKNCFIPDESTK